MQSWMPFSRSRVRSVQLSVSVQRSSCFCKRLRPGRQATCTKRRHLPAWRVIAGHLLALPTTIFSLYCANTFIQSLHDNIYAWACLLVDVACWVSFAATDFLLLLLVKSGTSQSAAASRSMSRGTRRRRFCCYCCCCSCAVYCFDGDGRACARSRIYANIPYVNKANERETKWK